MKFLKASNLIRLVLTTVAVLIQVACVSQNPTATPKNYQLTLPENPHLTFSGRGAASGPMLMGAMGAAGIAVGLAIDVGIAKDIEKGGFANGLAIAELFSTAVTESRNTSPSGKTFFSKTKTPNFNVTKIGFMDAPGQSDHIVAVIELAVKRGEWQKSYRYPEDFAVTPPQTLKGAKLEQLKSPSSPAQEILQQALISVITRGLDDWSGDSRSAKK